MPRRPEATKHPALASRNRQEEVQRVESDAGLRSIWDSLSEDQKSFLAVLPMYSSHAETARAMGKDSPWIDSQKAKHPIFADAIAGRLFTDKPLAQAIARDKIGWSCNKLIEMIESPKTTERTRLDAIKHLHRVAGVGLDTAPLSVSQTNFIDLTTLVSIAKNRKRRRPQFNTVEGELVDG